MGYIKDIIYSNENDNFPCKIAIDFDNYNENPYLLLPIEQRIKISDYFSNNNSID